MKTPINEDLPTEQVPGRAEEIAKAIARLTLEYYPQSVYNAAQVLELLEAFAMVSAKLIAQTGDDRTYFTQQFIQYHLRETLLNESIRDEKRQQGQD